MGVIFKKNVNQYKVSTPNGYKMFSGISYMGDKEIYHCKFEDNIWLESTIDHKIYISNTEYKTINELEIGDCILTSVGKKKLLEKMRIVNSYDIDLYLKGKLCHPPCVLTYIHVKNCLILFMSSYLHFMCI